MPTSRSPKPSTEAAPTAIRPRYVRLFILIVVLAILLVALAALPASLIKRFLPPAIGAEDFSGTVWHGSAGRITLNALAGAPREAGALEWRLHPWRLFESTLSADLHWVKLGFVADGSADIDRHGATLRGVEGGGPLEDLAELGLPPGWRGTASFKIVELKALFANHDAILLTAAVGDVRVAGLTSPQVADGADLGGYLLHAANGAITPDADASAQLSDLGGPLEVMATIHFAPGTGAGMLSGTIKERPDAPPALRAELANLTQLHARDAQGRIPVDLEFTL